MTIHEIKRRVKSGDANNPFFFSRDTLRFFGQTLRSFKVRKQPDGRYKISAPMYYGRSGEKAGDTVRFFDPTSNTLSIS